MMSPPRSNASQGPVTNTNTMMIMSGNNGRHHQEEEEEDEVVVEHAKTKKQKIGHGSANNAAAAAHATTNDVVSDTIPAAAHIIDTAATAVPPPMPPLPPLPMSLPLDNQRPVLLLPPPPPMPSHFRCAGCGVTECAATGPLLLFEDPQDDAQPNGNASTTKNMEEGEEEKR